MTQAAQWGRLPAELRQCAQWVIAGPDKQPLSVDPNGNLYKASVTAPEQWLSFDAASYFAEINGHGIGFVLHKDDPFSCIDFDVKDATNAPDKPETWTQPEQFEWFWTVAKNFNSYTEMSRSGKGLHIWVKGKIGKGVRKHSTEIYSQERYIICTGHAVIDQPIIDRQEWLVDMAARLGVNTEARAVKLEELGAIMEDHAIMQMAWEAENSHKFKELWFGRWQQFGFPSQSEADLALMSMFTFYSRSNEQCRRLFRMSGLGTREKAVKDNRYLDFTLTTIRTRQANEVKIDARGIEAAAEHMRLLRAQKSPPLTLPGLATAEPAPLPASVAITLAAPVSPAVAAVADKGLPWPPGFVGAMAQYIYDSAPRPVKEVAIVGALGLMAGIAGKVWFIPNSGLNIYMILVARSAIGKEQMHTGISSLLKAGVSRCPTMMNFADFSDFASGPALVKACVGNSSFVNVCGEWGHKLKRIAIDDGRDSAMATLRMTMTNLYQKSGPQSIVGGISYSNKESNIASISGVAYSMIGETTPKTFYDALTESMMEDGFLSRFTIVEYTGDRPDLNTNQLMEPPKELGDWLGFVAQTAQGHLGNVKSFPVNRSNEAAHMMADFEAYCDAQIKGRSDEAWRQMWNRASLKVMRIAALLAVGNDCLNPVVIPEQVEWAKLLVERDIAIMTRKIEAGEVGTDDHTRERKLMSIVRDYIVNGVSEGYKIPKAMQENAIVPHKLFQIRCSKLTAFTKHKMGAIVSIRETVRSLIENNYLMDVQKEKMVDAYNFHGKCYRVLNTHDFDPERNGA